jgi:hypothetical protein
MEKVMVILTTAGGLAVKLLDFYSGLFAKGMLRTVMGMAVILLVALLIAVYLKPIGFLLARPFLRSVSDWAAALAMRRTEEPGTPKPYVLHMRLTLRELFRKALADVGLYGRTNTDALCTILVRRGRNLSEDAGFGGQQGLIRRSESLRKQSSRYLNLVRAIERERASRLFQVQDYYADAAHLSELELPCHPGEPLKGFCHGLFSALLFNAADYHAFRNLIRSSSIRPDGTLLRFHTEAAREHFANRMQRCLDHSVPYVMFTWLLMPQCGLRFSVYRYLFKSSNLKRSYKLDNVRGPGYEVRFEAEQGRQQATFRFEVITAGTALLKRIQETGTHEIMSWAAGKAALDGVLLGSAYPVEAGSVSARHIVSERYRLDNPYDRKVFAHAVSRFIARQAEAVVEQEPEREETGKGGPV